MQKVLLANKLQKQKFPLREFKHLTKQLTRAKKRHGLIVILLASSAVGEVTRGSWNLTSHWGAMTLNWDVRDDPHDDTKSRFGRWKMNKNYWGFLGPMTGGFLISLLPAYFPSSSFSLL